jgi:S1-C subfamily serine protease
VWDKEGHIVTNNHVVAGADKISVTFYDGTIVSGEVVGTDPDSDLAVVKVDVPADRLQPVQRPSYHPYVPRLASVSPSPRPSYKRWCRC